MEKLFQVNIITPEETVYKGEVLSLVVPAELGYLGVLVNHAALVTNLVPGRISFRDALGNLKTLDSKGRGFLEVLNNTVTLLLDK